MPPFKKSNFFDIMSSFNKSQNDLNVNILNDEEVNSNFKKNYIYYNGLEKDKGYYTSDLYKEEKVLVKNISKEQIKDLRKKINVFKERLDAFLKTSVWKSRKETPYLNCSDFDLKQLLNKIKSMFGAIKSDYNKLLEIDNKDEELLKLQSEEISKLDESYRLSLDFVEEEIKFREERMSKMKFWFVSNDES